MLSWGPFRASTNGPAPVGRPSPCLATSVRWVAETDIVGAARVVQTTHLRRRSAARSGDAVVLPFRTDCPSGLPGRRDAERRTEGIPLRPAGRVARIRARNRVQATRIGIATAAALASGIATSQPVAWMWLILVVVIAGHEGGHYLAARRFRYHVHEVVVGVGPCLARFGNGDLTVELRLLPVVGWVEADTSDRGPYRHRRRFWFAAAGPVASTVLGFMLLLGGYVSTFGFGALTREAVVSSGRITLEAVAEVPATAVRSVMTVLAAPAGHEARAGHSAPSNQDRAELTSVVGATGAMGDDVADGGVAVVAVWAAVISASIAGFNLIPAFGLDGHRMAEAVVDDVAMRRPVAGRVLRVVLTGGSVAVGVCVGILVVRLLLSDMLGLL
jgi:hypothetical protein